MSPVRRKYSLVWFTIKIQLLIRTQVLTAYAFYTSYKGHEVLLFRHLKDSNPQFLFFLSGVT